jgi:hypothetical protein
VDKILAELSYENLGELRDDLSGNSDNDNKDRDEDITDEVHSKDEVQMLSNF